MSNNNWKVNNDTLNSIISNYGLIASGATLSLPHTFPKEFESIGVHKRDDKRNDYYGMTITNPPNRTNNLVFGFSYLDNADNQTDEDIYVLDTMSKMLNYYPKGKYEKENPLYLLTHKGDKTALIQPK
jgi:fructose-bisphosphate aldolase class 1